MGEQAAVKTHDRRRRWTKLIVAILVALSTGVAVVPSASANHVDQSDSACINDDPGAWFTVCYSVAVFAHVATDQQQDVPRVNPDPTDWVSFNQGDLCPFGDDLCIPFIVPEPHPGNIFEGTHTVNLPDGDADADANADGTNVFPNRIKDDICEDLSEVCNPPDPDPCEILTSKVCSGPITVTSSGPGPTGMLADADGDGLADGIVYQYPGYDGWYYLPG